MNITRILCPTDLSDASSHAVDLATMIAGWYNARITALHVVSAAALPEFSLPGGSVDEAPLDVLRTAIGSRFSEASRAGVGIDVLLEVGSPAACILDKAAALPADLIVMGTHGTSGFQHLVLGSVTERVLRKGSMSGPHRTAARTRDLANPIQPAALRGRLLGIVVGGAPVRAVARTGVRREADDVARARVAMGRAAAAQIGGAAG